MRSYADFARRCRMRHDFADQFQVRYDHPGGESYDTWVSGEEVLSRLRSGAAETRLRHWGRLQPDDLGEAWEKGKREAKESLMNRLRDRFGDGVDALAGGNPLGDSLAENVRGRDDEGGENWPSYLHDEAFRAVALELAWINLRGSFPDSGTPDEPDDWV
jgi:hypothetical protein